MTTYTSQTKDILRADILFIDQQLEFARGKMAQGDKAEAWSTLDSLLGYFDFKKHFPDIFVNENQIITFQDMYESLRDIDDIIEIDAIQMLTGANPLDWRPGHSRDEILSKLQAFLRQIDTWQALNWFEGDEIEDALDILKEKVQAFIHFFQHYTKDQFLFKEMFDVKAAKMQLWRSLSDDLPFADIYDLLMTMDRDLTFLVFKFRLHIDDVDEDMVKRFTEEIEEKKHAILAIIDAVRADDEIIEDLNQTENENNNNEENTEEEKPPFQQPPPGWDDLKPFPPPGYAMIGNSIVPMRLSRRTGRSYFKLSPQRQKLSEKQALKQIGITFAAMVLAVLSTILFMTSG